SSRSVQMVAASQGVPVLCLALILRANGANILGLFGSLSPSHLVIQMSMARILAESGHNVTVVTVLEPPIKHKDINHILVPLPEEDLQSFGALVADMAKNDNSNPVGFLYNTVDLFKELSTKMSSVVKHHRFRDLYENEDNRFDLVITGYFLNCLHLTVAQKLKVPQVVTISNPPSFLGDMLGNPRESSYVPSSYMTLKPGEIMGLQKRALNLIYTWAEQLFTLSLETHNEQIYREIFGADPSVPSYTDLQKNISVIFFASHEISERPIRPNVPSVIEVGGIQIKDQPDPLPENLEKFLKDAPHGAILLSMGSNLKGSHLNSDTIGKMFNVLSKLRQKVIWKWDDLENLPGKSENILYAKWLPQDDILAHPNIKMFITHAGKGGITEAQFHGKPMLALPVFFDQPRNAEAMEQQGFGLVQSLFTLEEDSFREGIREVLENPKYERAVKSFSALYRDRPLSARDTLNYWVDYVIRHHGAPHLQSPVIHMSSIAALNLDVYAVFSATIFVLFLIFKIVTCFLIRQIQGKWKRTKSTQKRKIKEQ
ncbi:hypothetical protein KR009_000229, partial [Drosophila setifemur]